MNPIYFSIITATVALIALVFAIFGAAWLNGRNIERMIDSLKGELHANNESLKSELRAEVKRIDQRIDSLQHLLNHRLDGIENRLDGVDKRLDRVERQLEAIFKPSLPR